MFYLKDYIHPSRWVIQKGKLPYRYFYGRFAAQRPVQLVGVSHRVHLEREHFCLSPFLVRPIRSYVFWKASLSHQQPAEAISEQAYPWWLVKIPLPVLRVYLRQGLFFWGEN